MTTTRNFKAPTPTGGTKFLCPEGTHISRCYLLVDLGTQTTNYLGEEKVIRQVMLTFELPEEMRVFNEEKGPQPCVISTRALTLSMGAKANLRKMIELWRGKSLTNDEAKEFDLAALVGQPSLLTIEHETTSADKTYANIVSATRPPKSMVCPDQINPSVVYMIDDRDGGDFKKLPEWIKKKVMASKEWNQPVLEQVPGSLTTERENQQADEKADSGLTF